MIHGTISDPEERKSNQEILIYWEINSMNRDGDLHCGRGDGAFHIKI